MRFSTRELVIMTVFGTMWGAVEIGLGSLLHTVNAPLSGPILGAVGMVIALTGRHFVPRRGSTLYLGVVTMILKLFSIGAVKTGPMVGILAEALLAELVLSLAGQPKRSIFMVAGGLGVFWAFVQPFFTGLVLFGRDFPDIWSGVIAKGGDLLGLDSGAVVAILLILVAIHLLMGAIAGWIAWDAGLAIQRRLGTETLVQER